ncbi:MFS general substrate transporter [Microthyrium microscopicum]|uniref:Probable transporter MCH1 n=1 Tax=Microthyrium microscopicum TaxID=703497 RepID=A0A6A6U9L5_9PEZI|nr:MFS general substrate transporter [Microthyrium microscopicum]
MAPDDVSRIDKRDFDQSRRPLLGNGDHRADPSPDHSVAPSIAGSFFEQVAEGIQERDREKMQTEVTRYVSFAVAVLCCLCCGSITAYSLYGHLFMSHLKYSQGAVNIISIAAELALYLPVTAFGYLCDRSGPRMPSILAGLFFGGGYFTAAMVYHAGPPPQFGGSGWPFWMMVVAFVAIGMGTSCMYMAAVSTCAKNFGRGKNKGIALACPIAAFGLSGMLVSQIGSRILYVTKPNGGRGDVDVFKFFMFLAVTLFIMGVVGGFGFRIVDESEMIEEAIGDLEQSGLLRGDEFFEEAAHHHGYGTMARQDLSRSTVDFLLTEAEELKKAETERKARKDWLLNGETRRFLSDHTMWWLAAGFFLITGPGEAFINNVGTIIGTLYPPSMSAEDIPTTAATHVSIIAITSTISRLFTGTLSDFLAPLSEPHQHNRGPASLANSFSSLPPRKRSISRMWFLLTFAILLSIGQALLASGLIQNHGSRFWLVSALIGGGYGAVFSLTPIIISVVWGVENFATNWGIVATVPAGGAAVWSIVYSAVYEYGARPTPVDGSPPEFERDRLCYGTKCYASTFWAMSVSVWIACGLWIFAWRGPSGWKSRGVAL